MRPLPLLVCASLFLAAGAVLALQQPSSEDEARSMALISPNEHHKVLDFKVGKWKGHIRMWMAPGAPAMEWDGSSTFEWILGGRYLQDRTQATFMGMPFEGHGLSGYDNIKQKYFSTWIDTMGTGIMLGEGSWDAAKKVLTSTASMPDAMSGAYVTVRGTETPVDADHWTMEMFSKGPDGKEFRSMSIEYTRAK